MRTWPLVFLFGVLNTSSPCFAVTDAPVAPVAGSADYRFLKIGKELPGFGGMFLDNNGALNVYMLHPEIAAPAVDASLRASSFLTRQEAVAAYADQMAWRDQAPGE
jgi:hypothetical protein